MTDQLDTEALKALLEAGTPGPWREPHLNHPEIRCDCAHIFADGQGHMGSICTMDVSGEHDGDHGQPVDEAKANAALIVAAVNVLPSLLARIAELEKANAWLKECGLASTKTSEEFEDAFHVAMKDREEIAEAFSSVVAQRDALVEASGPFIDIALDTYADSAVVALEIDFTREEAEALNLEIEASGLPIKKAGTDPYAPDAGMHWPKHCVSLDGVEVKHFRALRTARDACREEWG